MSLGSSVHLGSAEAARVQTARIPEIGFTGGVHLHGGMHGLLRVDPRPSRGRHVVSAAWLATIDCRYGDDNARTLQRPVALYERLRIVDGGHFLRVALASGLCMKTR